MYSDTQRIIHAFPYAMVADIQDTIRDYFEDIKYLDTHLIPDRKYRMLCNILSFLWPIPVIFAMHTVFPDDVYRESQGLIDYDDTFDTDFYSI